MEIHFNLTEKFSDVAIKNIKGGRDGLPALTKKENT